MKIHNSMYATDISEITTAVVEGAGYISIGPQYFGTFLKIKLQLCNHENFYTTVKSYSIGTSKETIPVDWLLSSSSLEAIACHAMTKLFVIPAIPALRDMKCCQTCKHFKSLNRNPVYIGWTFPGPACYPLIEDVFCLDSYACWEQSDA